MYGLTVRGVTKHFHRTKRTNDKPRFHQKLQHIFRREKEVIRAVDDISLEVNIGEIYGILGANGSGKSTLLLPDAGSIQVFGDDVVNNSLKVRQVMNRVSVEASFFKRLSSEENLIYAARLYGIPAPEAERKSKQILERLGFDADRMNEEMEHLSRGMQQKVAIARALLTTPMLLLLDEPTTGLDPKSKRDVQAFIEDIRRERNAVIVLTTHDMAEAERLCDKIAIIDKGQFIAEGTVEELIANAPSQNGVPATLEDVFIALTGKGIEEED
ncbi:ABC transporter ATP-binding protein [Candidatus Poribacteria bacterium]|nr:ABC transporter ATP-binding protein [Candidatus Poribacteria bacterium]MYA56806.1 ABC transporter ATP-binding protein [Candidatus Poribacteria bacterium]